MYAIHFSIHIVVCGPSGVGKTTLIKRLLNDYPNRFGFSVSHTTRNKRGQERDGVSLVSPISCLD